MKIAFDAKRAFRNFSGLGNYSRTTIKLLSEFFPEHEYPLFTPGKSGDPLLFDGFPPSGCPVIYPSGIYSRFGSLWRISGIARDIRTVRPDIFHGLSNELPRSLRKFPVRKVLTVHDLIFLRYPELYPFIDRQIYRAKTEYSLKMADRIIAISEQTKDDIRRFFHIEKEKISVVYQSGDPAYSEVLSEEKKKVLKEKYNLPSEYLLYVGTIEERKNLLRLLIAKRKGNLEIPLFIVGKEKNYAKKVFSYIRENQMKDVVHLKDVSSADLPGLYQLASIFIYPSSFEGFGLPVLEAIQSGTPVIAGKGSCLEETGGPHSVYIDPFNTEEFIYALKTILENNSLRNKMREEGLKFSRNFLPEVSVRNLMKVYESLL